MITCVRIYFVCLLRLQSAELNENVISIRSKMHMSMNRLLLRCVISLSLLFAVGDAYRPVILLHGILSSALDMGILRDRILAAHPGTDILNVDLYEDLDSIKPMSEQVAGVMKEVIPFMANATDGLNMICYSQGALLCRAVIETMSDHNVHTFISLAGPHGGQFGDTQFVNILFPKWTRDLLFELFYTDIGQDISIANYWKDPRHLAYYYQYCKFLPALNNASATHKANFLKLKQAVFIGGPDDGVITPWQSSHFGYYDDKLNIVEYQDQEVYVNDTFGLQTLDKTGRMKVYVIPHVEHLFWPWDKEVFETCIEPWLQ